MIARLAPAKLNLGLRILARRSDGYHDLETVFLPLDLCDELEIEARDHGGFQLRVVGADLPQDSGNLAIRAAVQACEATGFPPHLDIRLKKRIPIEAGLGGGSSDAATVLLAVEELAGKPLEKAHRLKLARELGADVPFFLDPVPSIGRGIGDRLSRLDGVPEMFWVLVAFPFGVSTAWAFKAATAELTLPQDESSIAALLGPSGVVSSPPNDLERVAAGRYPEIAATREALEREGAMMTGMTGSGPTVFGRFPSRETGMLAARRMALPEGARAILVGSPGSS